MEQTVYIGIDYHQHFLQICVLDRAGAVLCNRRCDNSLAELLPTVSDVVNARNVDKVGNGSVTRIHAAIEAGCGSADLAEALTVAGWSVSLAHAGYVSRIRQSPDKTDFSDARLLADLTRVGYLPRVWLAPTVVRELRALVRERQSLADERRRIKQQIRGQLREHRQRTNLRAWTKAWFIWLNSEAELGEQGRWIVNRRIRHLDMLCEEIETVEARLREVTIGDAVIERLLRQSGIGEVTAWTLRAEIGRFDRFRTGKQLSRFCGLSPRNASSGERTADAGMIKAGQPQLRAILIEAAHRLAMHDPRWKAFHAQLKARGKPGSVIAAAIANRWVRGLLHEMKELPAMT